MLRSSLFVFGYLLSTKFSCFDMECLQINATFNFLSSLPIGRQKISIPEISLTTH